MDTFGAGPGLLARFHLVLSTTLSCVFMNSHQLTIVPFTDAGLAGVSPDLVSFGSTAMWGVTEHHKPAWLLQFS